MHEGILIISRNNIHLTKKAVNTALAQDVPCDVLVVDNASTDGTDRWLNSKDSNNLHTVYLPHGRSLAGCWNLGLRILWIAGCTKALVCNNDIELRPDTVRLLSALELSLVSCVSVDTRERMGKAGDRDLDYLTANLREHPDFSCFLLSKTVTDQNLWFDEMYAPAYCEDCDYHVRMHRAGIKAWCTDLPFLHHAAQTIKAADEGEAARIRRGADANRQRFFEKYKCYPGTPEYSELFK